jgi:predicted nucleic acid-binding protein
VTEVTSRHYAKIHRQLKRDGRAIPANDIWIAATAMELDCPIFTFDKHFKYVKNLSVVSSEADWIKLNS